jgi:hypothetical protein
MTSFASSSGWGSPVEECGYDTVCVKPLVEAADPVVETQLRLYVGVWQATRPDVSAAVERATPRSSSRRGQRDKSAVNRLSR